MPGKNSKKQSQEKSHNSRVPKNQTRRGSKTPAAGRLQTTASIPCSNKNQPIKPLITPPSHNYNHQGKCILILYNIHSKLKLDSDTLSNLEAVIKFRKLQNKMFPLLNNHHPTNIVIVIWMSQHYIYSTCEFKFLLHKSR